MIARSGQMPALGRVAAVELSMWKRVTWSFADAIAYPCQLSRTNRTVLKTAVTRS
jgi:hypothetical protein